MHKKSKKTKGVFVFGSNNSSSSSVNSDMAYGMGFIRKPKSRGGGFSPNVAAAAASMSGRERSEGRPGLQRRQTDEEILEIGRKLQDVARMQNRADLERRGKTSWESHQRQSSSGVEVSSRGLGSSKHGRRHHHTSSSDDEWESASEGEDSDALSALAYGHTPIPTPRPAKSSTSRMSTASAIAAGSALVAGSAIAASSAPDRKSTIVDPKLFGPMNSLRDFVNTPCGFNENGGAYTPGPEAQGYAGSAESASLEARPLQRVFPLQTSDPGHMEAARASGSIVSSQQNYSSTLRDRVYSNTSVSNPSEPVPIQAPKPIAPVPMRIYDEERIRDIAPSEPVEHRRKPTSDNKIYAETALVGAGVAALGAAILAGRGKGKEKEIDSELKHGKHEKYGHDDHRHDDTKVEDARKAQELRLMQEIERLEMALGKTNKAREQRRRDSKRDRDSGSHVDATADERRKSGVTVEEEKDHERERRRWNRQSKRRESPGYDSRVSEPSDRPALIEDDTRYRRVDSPGQSGENAPVDVFQFQVPDDAFTTGNTPPKAPSPYIIDVTPSPSPAPEQSRESRRGSLAEETRDAHRIYEGAHHSTAPIPEAVMAAAIGAVAHSRRHYDDEEGRGRTNARTADTIQEEANKVYAARRVAEREIRSRSRSKSCDDPVPRVPRIVTPPEMQNRPPKNPFSGANADFRFDMEMSPTQLLGYWPEVAPVRDASAERPRPVLNLVMPTPVPTPTPERQSQATVKEPEPVGDSKKDMSSVVIGPRGEVIEVVEAVEEPPTPSVSKRVSWGPSETKQYEEHSPERYREHSPPSEKSKKGFGGWGAIAAAVTGAGVGAALAQDNGPKSPKRDGSSRDSLDEKRSSGSRSPPKERPILSTGMSSRILTEEPEELPPAPGPKPASPRNSQQMPGAFDDDIDFAATLAAGLEHTGFDPEIVIENPEYRRRDSPPGSNEPYTQPFAETVSDLGVYNVDDGSRSLSREHGYVIGEVGTPGSEKAAPLSDFSDVSRSKSKKDKRSSSLYDDIEVIEEPEEAELDTSKLSKKERRKLEKAAQAAKIVQQEAQAPQPQVVEAGEDEWADAPTSKKSKKAKKTKRSSVAWDDADTPVNDARVSVPVHAFDDIKDARSVDDTDDWDTPPKFKASKRDSKTYEVPGDDMRDKEKRDNRRAEIYEPVDRDVASVASDSRYGDRSNGHNNGDDDERSVASAPSGSKRDSKRSSGGFWGLLGGKEEQKSKKDNADTFGAGVGLAGVAAVAMAAAVADSDAAEASSDHKQEEPHVERDVGEVEAFEDPEIAPRVIRPAIDPQYGDLLPLPPSPGESALEIDDEDALPALPDSRPTTPPGEATAVLREREGSMKRPHFAGHARRTSAAEALPRSPSHTAIPIQFRMGHRSMPATSPAIGSRSSPVVQSSTPPAQESPPMFKRNEFSPTFKRQPSRPTSWDNSREIKPLYLLERSARPAGEEEQRDEVAERIPLLPDREAPVPEDPLEHGKVVGLGVDTNPLVVDTNAAHSAVSGSQELTPTGPKPVEQLSSLAQDVEMTPLGFPSSSTLPESSYATPGEFPREVETTSSPQSEPLSSEPPLVKEVEKPENKSYFPSGLSILPAATLAGVGFLLGRGKKDEAHAIVDDHNSESAVDEPPPQSVEPLTGIAMNLPSDADQVDLSGSKEPDLESIVKQHSQVSQFPLSKAVDPQSPIDFEDTQTGFATTASQQAQPEITEFSPQTPIDTTDWAVETRSKKKKKGKKKKQSMSEAPQIAAVEDQDILPSPNVQRSFSTIDNTDFETVEGPPFVATSTMASATAQQSGTNSPKTVVAGQDVLEQSISSQPDVVDEVAESRLENRHDLDAGSMDTSFPEGSHDFAISQPDVTSGDALTHKTGQDAASITPVIEASSSPQPEAGGSASDVPALPFDVQQAESAGMSTESNPVEIDPVEADWATSSSKKRKSKKKNKQSINSSEKFVDSSVPASPGDKAQVAVQEPDLPHDFLNAMDVVEPPREPSQGSLETPTQPLGPEFVHDDITPRRQIEARNSIEEIAATEPSVMQTDEPSRDIPAEEVPILPSGRAEEPETDVSQFLVEEPATALSEQQQEFQQEIDYVPVSAEEEFPIVSKKSKKNKKRKDSKVVDEPVQSSAAIRPAARENVELPGAMPQQSTFSAEEDVRPAALPSESKDTGLTHDDAVMPLRAAARSPPPADEALRSAEALEDRPSEAQQDNQPKSPTLGSRGVLESPTSTNEVPQSSLVPETIGPLEAGTEPTLATDAGKSLALGVLSGKTTQPSAFATEPIAVPVQDKSPTKTLSPDLAHGSFEPRDLQETLEEVETTSREAGISTLGLEQSDFKQEADLEKPFDEEAVARREAEAVQIQEEKAEVARLQLKRNLSKKDKQRLRDLKARVQQRTEESQAAATSSSSAKDVEQPALESEVAQASPVADNQSTEVTEVAEPVLAEQNDQVANVSEFQETGSLRESADQDSENFHSADEGAQVVSHVESQQFEVPKEMARRGAEAAQIRDEETELARLKMKRKPSKKDKSRIKAFQANAEERKKEAEDTAQRLAEEQAALTTNTQDVGQTHVNLSQDIVPSSAEEILQSPTTSEFLKDGSQPQVDTSVEPASDDENTGIMDGSGQSHTKVPALDQPKDQAVQESDIHLSALSRSSQPDEHHVRDGQESTTQDQLSSSIPQDSYIPLSTPDLNREVSEPRSNDIAKAITESPSSSSDKPKNSLGGWGMIAAAVTGANIGAALGKDNQPEQIQESQILPEDDGAEGNNAMTQLESHARDVQEEPRQPKLQEDIQSHAEVKDALSPEEVPPPEIADSNSARFGEPVSSTEFSQQDKGVPSSQSDLESNQIAATEVQPDSEWSVPSKKSKKDKKKKRKGTLSGDSGENSAYITPLDTSEFVSVPEPAEVGGVGTLASQQQNALPVAGSDVAPLSPVEIGRLEQHDSTSTTSPRDHSAEDIAQPALNVADEDTQEDIDRTVGDLGHKSFADTAHSVTADGAGPGPSDLEQDVPLENLMDLPASFVRTMEAAPSFVEPVHSATEQEKLLAGQDLFQRIEPNESESHQLISSADEPTSTGEIAEDIAPQDQGIVPAFETSRSLPLETNADPSLVTEPQQLQDDEFSWAPAKKKEKKKKKRGSVAWSEPASGAQTPNDEKLPEPSKRDISQETGLPTQTSPQDEDLTEAQDSQPQLDDWSSITTSKKKKRDKKKQASISSWEPDSSPQTPLDLEPREIHDVGDFVESSGGTDTATQAPQPIRVAETLQQESAKIQDPESTPGQYFESHHMGKESIDQRPSGTPTQPEVPEESGSDKPATQTDLESKIGEGEDTPIVAGGTVLDADIPLTGEVDASQSPLATSSRPTVTEYSLRGEAIPELDLDSQVKPVDNPIIAVHQKVPIISERSVDLPPLSDPISGPDLVSAVGRGEDSLAVDSGKVADEVSEPWAFEATHDSPTTTKSDLNTRVEDGDGTVIVAGGQLSDDVVHPSHIQDDNEDASQRMTESSELLDVNRSASRPQSPAPWGDEDYSASRRDIDLEPDQPVARSASPNAPRDEEIISAGRDDDFSDVRQSGHRTDSPVPSDDNNSAFATPFEHAPVFAAEPDPILPSILHQDEEPFEWAPTSRSKKDKKKKKGSSSKTPDVELEPTTSMPETPQFGEPMEQQSLTDSVEAPGINDTTTEKAVEPATEDFDDWAPKKLTRKEKRKAKKGSMTIPEPEVTAGSLEDSQPKLVLGSQDRTPAADANLGSVPQEEPSQAGFGHLEKIEEAVQPTEDPVFAQPVDAYSLRTDRPGTPSPTSPDGSVEAVEPRETETLVDQQQEPSVSVPDEAAVTAAAAAVAVPVITRKMSKKEKRKAKKASSSWEDEALQTSQPQALVEEDVQNQGAPIVASPSKDPYLTREAALDVSTPKLQADEEVPVNLDTSTAAEAIAEDEWAVLPSREKHNGKKKGKQLSLDSFSGAQTRDTEDPPLPASAKMEELPKPVDRMVEETLAQFGVPASPPRPSRVKASEGSSVAQFEAKSPATLGIDPQKMPSAAPSPDPWENEDYFKPKSLEGSPTDPPEEPFGKLEIHPAFTRGLNTTSENRSRDERPLVGLGLIHRHSSIFQEDDGHTPKLLTLTSDNASIESLAIDETSQPGALPETYGEPGSEDSSELREQSVGPAPEGTKGVSIINAGLKQQADMLPAQEARVTTSSVHAQRRFPLSPRLSPSPAPEDPPKSPIPDEIKLSQRGSVAKLAQRFGGKRKKVSKYVDKRTPVEDDPFDNPALWEGAERKAVDGSRMDEDAGEFWAVEDTNLDDETSDPDVHSGQGSTSSPVHGMGTQHGDDNVSATHSSPGPDDGRFTPEISEKATRQEEVPLEFMVESPILGSQASTDIPSSPGPQRTATSPSSPVDVGPNQTNHQPTNIADTWNLIRARQHRDDLPSARSGSPTSDRGVGLEESVLPSIETEHGQSRDNFIPAVDFRRSVSRGLPPVQEEPLEEEAESGKHTASLAVTAPDFNRDSGFVTDSPNQAWARRFDDAQQRDSGVHMRDYRDRSPGLRSSLGGTPESSRVSRSSVEDDGARLEDKHMRSPLPKYERRFRGETPVLEAQEPPVTPEPQKPRSDGSRAHKYPDLRPGGTPATAAAALAGGALLARQESGAMSPSLSPAEGRRSVSDSFADKLRASASPQPETPSSQRRAVSNTRMSRAKTPEPLNLRPDSPSLLRHSGTPPLRSRRTRSGDLRTLSQSSTRSHSDLGIGAGAGAAASPSPVDGRTSTPAAAANTPVPASSSSSSDLRRTTTPAAAAAHAAHQTSTANPVANEGRVRSKDMADVYVSRLHSFALSLHAS